MDPFKVIHGVVFIVCIMCLQDNALDFMEYIAALHLVLRGNLEDRLRWSFKIYDKDGNGKLDRQEVKQIIRVGRISLLLLHSSTSIWNILICRRNIHAVHCSKHVLRPDGLRSPRVNPSLS